MSVEAETSQDLVRLTYKGGAMVLNTSRWGKNTGMKIAAYLQARLKAATDNKVDGEIGIKKLNKSGEPISVAFIEKKNLPKFKKLANRYSLLYSIVSGAKSDGNDTVDLFFRMVDAPKVKRILELAKIATVEPDLSKVEIENEVNVNSHVIHAKVDLGEAKETEMTMEQEKDPLTESPFEKQSGQKERVSVRAEIQKHKEETKGQQESERKPTFSELLKEELGKDKAYEKKP